MDSTFTEFYIFHGWRTTTGQRSKGHSKRRMKCEWLSKVKWCFKGFDPVGTHTLPHNGSWCWVFLSGRRNAQSAPAPPPGPHRSFCQTPGSDKPLQLQQKYLSHCKISLATGKTVTVHAGMRYNFIKAHHFRFKGKIWMRASRVLHVETDVKWDNYYILWNVWILVKHLTTLFDVFSCHL